jgi:hypothetical protein
MTKEELAKIINGREYENEITEEEEIIAKENGLVVMFYRNDDQVEFRGVLCDYLSMWDYDYFRIRKIHSVVGNHTEDTYKNAILSFYPFNIKNENDLNIFSVAWSPDTVGCAWLIDTEIPHSTIDIYDGEEFYCRGLIINVDDLK